jgi:hypothetical protein
MEEKVLSKLEKLDLLHQEHGEIEISWSGGGDEGCFEIYLGEKRHPWSGDFLNSLLDEFEDHLGYGSFAGEYSVSGSAEYFPSDGAFIGLTSESWDVDKLCEVNHKIFIPDYLWFDHINFLIEDDHCSVTFQINNGPVLDEHNSLEYEIADKLEELVSTIVFSRIYMDFNIDFKDFIHDEENKIRYYILEDINYCEEECHGKDIHFEI